MWLFIHHLSPFNVGASCVSKFHQGCRRIVEFGGRVGLVAWDSYGWVWILGKPTFKKVSCWLARNPSELGEGPSVLSPCGGRRKWGVTLCDCSLISLVQFWRKLCFSVSVRLQEERGDWEWGLKKFSKWGFFLLYYIICVKLKKTIKHLYPLWIFRLCLD